EAQQTRRGKSSRPELVLELGSRREARAVDCLERGKQVVEPEAIEVSRIEGDDRKLSLRGQHTMELRESLVATASMADEPQDGSVEPAAPERETLRAALLETDPRAGLGPGHAQHLARGIDAPDARQLALRQRGREPPGAAPHVEHALAAKVGLARDEL